MPTRSNNPERVLMGSRKISPASVQRIDVARIGRHDVAGLFQRSREESRDRNEVERRLASVLGSAVRYGLTVTPLLEFRSPPLERAKPYVTPEQFDSVVNLVSEPYGTMIYVCVMAGLRVSELVGLKWKDLHNDALTIDERYSKGEWGCPKTTVARPSVWMGESFDVSTD